MSKTDKYIDELIVKTKLCPRDIETKEIMNDKQIKQLYNEVHNIFNSNKYTKEQKDRLYKEAHLESLAMMI